jgi:PncC family amidohydrolase
MSIEENLQNLFVQHSWTLGSAESCTGGALSARLTARAGCSNYFLGGVVAYHAALKERFLDVPHSLIEEEGVVSEAVAARMALGTLARLQCDFAVATTGIAGPSGGTAQTPVGTVCIAVASRFAKVQSSTLHLKGERLHVIDSAVEAALQMLYRIAEGAC